MSGKSGTHKVYVGNLGNNGSKQELEKEFERFGRLHDVWVARNPPGFAFVEFEDFADAEEAIKALDGARICGERVRVEMARNKGNRGGGGGGGGGGSFRRSDHRDDRYGGGGGGGRRFEERGSSNHYDDRSSYRYVLGVLKFVSDLNTLLLQWNFNFSNLCGKRKSVREIGGKITVKQVQGKRLLV